MGKITFLKGDATNPIGDGHKYIVHVSNNIGAWGAGFVLALSKKWSEPEKVYREATEYNLGDIQLVKVEDDITVINMIGQENVGVKVGKLPPVRYVAIQECLRKVNEIAKQNNGSIHMPRIGCGLAGGEWSIMEAVIKSAVKDCNVYVYDFK